MMSELKFEKEVYINYTIFEGNVSFWGCEFEEFHIEHSLFVHSVDFGETKFKILKLEDTLFKSNIDFSSSDIDYLKIDKVIFESLVRFMDIKYKIIFIINTIFKDVMFFSTDEKLLKDRSEPNLVLIIKTVFDNEYSKIIHNSLSRISFLLTDVENLTIIASPDDKIFDEYLFLKLSKCKKNNNLEESINSKMYKNCIKEQLKDYFKESKHFCPCKDINECHCEDNKCSKCPCICKEIADVICSYLTIESVLKEYRSIRKSFEKKRTYIEASKLFIYEMDLIRKTTFNYRFDYEKFIVIIETMFNKRKRAKIIKKYIQKLKDNLWYIYVYSPFLLLLGFCWIYFKSYSVIFLVTIILFAIIYAIYYSKINTIISKVITWIIFWIYRAISNYGESTFKPLIYSVGFILLFPLIALYLNYFDLSKVQYFYFKCVSETLRAFFQLGIKDNKTLMYSYEWFIRIISLILFWVIYL